MPSNWRRREVGSEGDRWSADVPNRHTVRVPRHGRAIGGTQNESLGTKAIKRANKVSGVK